MLSSTPVADAAVAAVSPSPASTTTPNKQSVRYGVNNLAVSFANHALPLAVNPMKLSSALLSHSSSDDTTGFIVSVSATNLLSMDLLNKCNAIVAIIDNSNNDPVTAPLLAHTEIQHSTFNPSFRQPLRLALKTAAVQNVSMLVFDVTAESCGVVSDDKHLIGSVSIPVRELICLSTSKQSLTVSLSHPSNAALSKKLRKKNASLTLTARAVTQNQVNEEAVNGVVNDVESLDWIDRFIFHTRSGQQSIGNYFVISRHASFSYALAVQCEQLIKMDWSQLPSPLVAAYEKIVDNDTVTYLLRDHTEFIQHDSSPVFTRRLHLQLSRSKTTEYRLAVYSVMDEHVCDTDHLMAYVDVTSVQLLSLVRGRQSLTLPLGHAERSIVSKKLKAKGASISVRIVSIPATLDEDAIKSPQTSLFSPQTTAYLNPLLAPASPLSLGLAAVEVQQPQQLEKKTSDNEDVHKSSVQSSSLNASTLHSRQGSMVAALTALHESEMHRAASNTYSRKNSAATTGTEIDAVTTAQSSSHISSQEQASHFVTTNPAVWAQVREIIETRRNHNVAFFTLLPEREGGVEVEMSVETQRLDRMGATSLIVSCYEVIDGQSLYTDNTDVQLDTGVQSNIEFAKPLIVDYFAAQAQSQQLKMSIYNCAGKEMVDDMDLVGTARIQDFKAIVSPLFAVPAQHSVCVELPLVHELNSHTNKRLLQRKSSLILTIKRAVYDPQIHGRRQQGSYSQRSSKAHSRHGSLVTVPTQMPANNAAASTRTSVVQTTAAQSSGTSQATQQATAQTAALLTPAALSTAQTKSPTQSSTQSTTVKATSPGKTTTAQTADKSTVQDKAATAATPTATATAVTQQAKQNTTAANMATPISESGKSGISTPATESPSNKKQSNKVNKVNKRNNNKKKNNKKKKRSK